MTTGVYLLHFNKPYHHARHYLGYAKDMENRWDLHRRGQGARLTSVINQAGITFEVARIWKNATRKFERQLKNRKNSPQLCPICQAEKAATKGCKPKEVIKVTQPKLSELIRASAEKYPALERSMVTFKNLMRGAYAQCIDGQIYVDALGGAYAALWNDAPVDFPNNDVARNVLEACGLSRTFVKEVRASYREPAVWVTCAPEDSNSQSLVYRIQELGWKFSREEIAAWLEGLGL